MHQTKILFRVDASLLIGTGHVMRCLTLADAMHAEGAQCIFICREHPGNLIAQIRERGFAVSVLPYVAAMQGSNENGGEFESIYATWLGVEWATDAEQSIAGAGAMAVDWLIVDHYALDARWERKLRPLCRKLMVIDDLADRQHDCDLLLDQNFGRNAADYGQLVPHGCTVLAGPQYALLRPEFADLRNYSVLRRFTPKLITLLITMGGVDSVDATSRVLVALQNCQLPSEMRITVAMGARAPFSERVQLLAKKSIYPTEVKINVSNMAQLMADSDFVIGAAGSTVWELCCLAVPTLLVKVAENQTKTADLVAEVGAGIVIDASEINIRLPKEINHIIEDIDVMRRLSIINRTICDGTGVTIVIEKLFSDRIWQ
jgi:UDP-2,4-diacetamido-2,4,6-trideoxy-beta-L-altropyranose hydrolase